MTCRGWERACHALLVGGAVLTVPACGRDEPERPRTLVYEDIDSPAETAGLTGGRALLGTFEPYRLPDGLLRVRGALRMPDGVKLQLTIDPEGGGPVLAQTQFAVENGRFHSPPLRADTGPFPAGVYRLELMTLFDTAWQTAEVMRATDDGKRLRGPGMTRGANGVAAFLHVEDRRI
jgi:hypothetical protein